MSDESFLKDEFFRPFLDKDFDDKKFATQVVQAQTVADYLSKINENIKRLDETLSVHVTEHHQDLVSQAGGIEKLESVLDLMLSRTATLKASMAKIRRRVSEPHASISQRLTQLHNMQSTCQLLRKTVRVAYLRKRLQSEMKDIGKASAVVNELEYLFETSDWDGVEVLETARRTTQQTREELEAQAWTLVAVNPESGASQTQLGVGLQVFHNLNCLGRVVNKLVGDWQSEWLTSLSTALDTTALTKASTPVSGVVVGPGRATMPSGGQAAAVRATLWTGLDRLLDQLHQIASRVRLLQKILAKKRDPNNQKTLLECLQAHKSTEPSILSMLAAGALSPDLPDSSSGDQDDDLLTWASRQLAQQFSSAVERSTLIKQAFEGEYPKLLKLFLDLGRRLIDLFGLAADPGGDAAEEMTGISPGPAHMPACFWLFLGPLETAYLSRSLSRLFDQVELGFSRDGLPTSEEVDALVKAGSSELAFSTVDQDLLVKVARNIAKTVRLFATRAEHLVVMDGRASQVVEPPSEGQHLNVRIVNTLHLFHMTLEKVVLQQHLPASALALVREALETVVVLIRNAVDPLLQSISDSLEAIIITMHHEEFAGDDTQGSGGSRQCSLYMQELQEFIVRVQAQYLSGFQCPALLSDCLISHVTRCIEVFLIHASLVRPLGDGGKMRLAADCAELELAVSPLCGRVADVGPAYRRLRAFRPLLFQSTEHILENPHVGTDALPPSLVLHFLFSRAPSDLRSPHHSAGWSLGRYSQWLLDHPTERDRLHFIKGALEAYVNTVRSQGLREYADIYPKMMQLLQKGLKESNGA